MPRVILALPAFNEAENLPGLVASAEEVFRANRLEYAILVVDDGSTDNTAMVLQAMAAGGRLAFVRHTANRGLGAAILTATREALEIAGPDDVIVNMDADNTHDPSYIPGMLAQLRAGYDVVIASRYRDGSREVGVPLFRRILSRGARIVFQVALRLPEVRDYTCGYRAYRSAVLRAALDKYGDGLITRQGFACTDELLVKISTVTRRITEIPFVLRYDKKRGRSKLPLFRTIIETLKMLLRK